MPSTSYGPDCVISRTTQGWPRYLSDSFPLAVVEGACTVVAVPNEPLETASADTGSIVGSWQALAAGSSQAVAAGARLAVRRTGLGPQPWGVIFP